MKFYLLVVGLAAGIALANGAASGLGTCSVDEGTCTSRFSGFPHLQPDMNKYTKQMLDKSFDFLLLSAVFDVYSLDRPGFEKLYRKTSDKAWEDTIELIKYQSRRGAYVQLGAGSSAHDVSSLLQSNETSSLQLALEYEKLLANEAHRMHKKISHADSTKHYDPDVAHYLDEKLIEYQSGQIRKLAGYITNLNDIVREANTKELGVQLFDEYLDKAE
ncbi:AAEL002158-PA [Aedes aegypti]|uniref:Ferritin n=2 Tax=Aedes aegypti TaxID=7159 RepID=A6KV25_AEDAE|nr:soma ferritin [Aedes aegypti]AQY17412.1 second ferritin light chain-like protein [Aedes aegypti]EAT46663.1 AAEL002158-PB [Aedes aegypti]EAT46664.1 AAEL002158-PA [Aedes aegypti]